MTSVCQSILFKFKKIKIYKYIDLKIWRKKRRIRKKKFLYYIYIFYVFVIYVNIWWASMKQS